jgi:hypothetical protein
VEARRGLQNLYSHRPSKLPEHAGRIDELVERAVEAEPSPYDSHPRPADRFRWVRALSGDTDDETDVGEPAWELFEDRAQIEEWMTHVVRARVAEQTGVVIPADPNERAHRRPML